MHDQVRFSTAILSSPKLKTLPNVLLSEKFENLKSKLGYLFILKSSWKCICRQIGDKNVPMFTSNISKRVKQVLWPANLEAFLAAQWISCHNVKKILRYCAINFFQLKSTKIQSTTKIKEKKQKEYHCNYELIKGRLSKGCWKAPTTSQRNNQLEYQQVKIIIIIWYKQTKTTN